MQKLLINHEVPAPAPLNQGLPLPQIRFYQSTGEGIGSVLARKGSILFVDTGHDVTRVPLENITEGKEYVPADPGAAKLNAAATLVIPHLLRDTVPTVKPSYEDFAEAHQDRSVSREYEYATTVLERELAEKAWVKFEADGKFYGLICIVADWCDGSSSCHPRLFCMPWERDMPTAEEIVAEETYKARMVDAILVSSLAVFIMFIFVYCFL